MLKLRALTLSMFVGAATLLTGCFEDVEAPRIKNLAVNPYVVTSAGAQIQGMVEYDTDKASVSFKVSRVAESGAVIDASSEFDFSQSITLSSSPASLGTFKPRGTVSDGLYTLAVTVVDDESNSTTEKTSFKIGEGVVVSTLGNNSGSNTFVLGAQSAAAGSFLDVDKFTQFSSDNDRYTKTLADKRSIDLVFFASSINIPMLMSPKEAAAQGLGGVETWGDANLKATIIAKASGPITTREQAIAAIGANTSQKAEAQEGATYALFLVDANIYASITLTSLGGAGKSSTATVSVLSE